MRFLRLYYSRFIRDETPRLAASLAFYTLFALAPFLLLLMSIASFLGVERRIALSEQVRALVRPEAAESARAILSAVSSPPALTSLVGLASALAWAFSASLLIAELRTSLTLAFGDHTSLHLRPPKNTKGFVHDTLDYLKSRLVSLVFVFVFTLIALVSLTASSYLAFRVGHHPELYVWGLNLITSFVVSFVAFAAVYLYLPTCHVSVRRGLKAGLITAALFVVGKELIGLYIGRAAFASVYGAAGSLTILLLWIYYSSLILLVGAQLTVVLDRPRPHVAPDLDL